MSVLRHPPLLLSALLPTTSLPYPRLAWRKNHLVYETLDEKKSSQSVEMPSWLKAAITPNFSSRGVAVPPVLHTATPPPPPPPAPKRITYPDPPKPIYLPIQQVVHQTVQKQILKLPVEPEIRVREPTSTIAYSANLETFPTTNTSYFASNGPTGVISLDGLKGDIILLPQDPWVTIANDASLNEITIGVNQGAGGISTLIGGTGNPALTGDVRLLSQSSALTIQSDASSNAIFLNIPGGSVVNTVGGTSGSVALSGAVTFSSPTGSVTIVNDIATSNIFFDVSTSVIAGVASLTGGEGNPALTGAIRIVSQTSALTVQSSSSSNAVFLNIPGGSVVNTVGGTSGSVALSGAVTFSSPTGTVNIVNDIATSNIFFDVSALNVSGVASLTGGEGNPALTGAIRLLSQTSALTIRSDASNNILFDVSDSSGGVQDLNGLTGIIDIVAANNQVVIEVSGQMIGITAAATLGQDTDNTTDTCWGTANGAYLLADEAKQAANSAQSTADSAQSAANAAQSTANSAQSTANGAATAAAAAQGTATAAAGAAATAQATAVAAGAAAAAAAATAGTALAQSGVVSVDGRQGAVTLSSTSGTITITSTSSTNINLDVSNSIRGGVTRLNDLSGAVAILSPNNTIAVGTDASNNITLDISGSGVTRLNDLSGAITILSPNNTITVGTDVSMNHITADVNVNALGLNGTSNIIFYDSSSELIRYSPFAFGYTFTQTATFDVTPDMYGATLIVTQNTTFTSGSIGSGYAGKFYVIVRNGGGTTSDYTLTGVTGANVVRRATGSHNAGQILMYYTTGGFVGV